MKLLRVGEPKKEIPAVLDEKNKIRDISNYIPDLNPKSLNGLSATPSLLPMSMI